MCACYASKTPLRGSVLSISCIDEDGSYTVRIPPERAETVIGGNLEVNIPGE